MTLIPIDISAEPSEVEENPFILSLYGCSFANKEVLNGENQILISISFSTANYDAVEALQNEKYEFEFLSNDKRKIVAAVNLFPSDGESKLAISPKFIKAYKLNTWPRFPFDNSSKQPYLVHIQKLNHKILNLERVVIAPCESTNLNQELLQLLQENLNKSTSPVLCQGVTTVIGEYEFDVLETYPFLQGIVTKNTKIICSKKQVKQITDQQTDNILPQMENKYYMEFAILCSSPSILHVENKFANRDKQIEVRMKLSTIQNLKLDDGSWVFISSKNIRRMAMLVSLDPSDHKYKNYSNNTIFLSSQMMFNLNLTLGENVEIKSATDEIISKEDQIFTLATEVQLSHVYTENTHAKQKFNLELSNYFEIPKIVHKDDIFAVPLLNLHSLQQQNDLSSDSEDEDYRPNNLLDIFDQEDVLQLPKQRVAYFKVVSIFPENVEFYFIDKEKTVLKQNPSVHSKLPVNISISKKGFMSKTQYPAGTEKIFTKLMDILEPCVHPLAPQLDLSCFLLMSGPSGSGKFTIINESANQLGLNLFQINCFELVGQIDSYTEVHLKNAFEEAKIYSPCILLLKNIHALESISQPNQDTKDSMIGNILKKCFHSLKEPQSKNNNNSHIEYPVLVIGTTFDSQDLVMSIRSCFRNEIILESPNSDQRYEMLKFLTENIPLGSDVSLKEIASKTASLLPSDLYNLVQLSGFFVSKRSRILIEKERELDLEKKFQEINFSFENSYEMDICSAGIALSRQDFLDSLLKLQSSKSTTSIAKIPNVSWDDVGGLAAVKNTILDTIQLPLQRPLLFSSGTKKRSGILLYGPPGTGKTLLAKAVATECNLNFLNVKGPELINMYVGESEKNVRDIFQKARDAKPCVIFFDELDSLAPNRGNGADSGGVMDRIVSQLLAELDGMQKSVDVFVIGATNRPDLIDPSLLRPGRFDELVYLSVSTDKKSQLNILEALSRKFQLGSSVNLKKIAKICPFNLTGADFYALCSDALVAATREKIENFENGLQHLKNGENIEEPTDNNLVQDTSIDNKVKLEPEIKRVSKKSKKKKKLEKNSQKEENTKSETEIKENPIDEVNPENELSENQEIDSTIIVEQWHFEEALKKLTPSVSPEELERYEYIKRQFNPDQN